jgi:hypothetical protein
MRISIEDRVPNPSSGSDQHVPMDVHIGFPVWFLWDRVRILVFGLPNTQKVITLRNDPCVSLALEAADQGYDIIRLHGPAALSDDPELCGTMPAFVKSMPTYRAAGRWKNGL